MRNAAPVASLGAIVAILVFPACTDEHDQPVTMPEAVAPPRIGFRHLSSANGDLPIPGGSRQQTASLIADLDSDGVNDFVLGFREVAPALVGYRRTDVGWDRMVIEDEFLTIEAGGAAHDIDDDGDVDLVFGGDWQSTDVWWWENPAPDFNPGVSWIRRLIKTGGQTQHHDQAFGDFLGTGRPQLAFWNQRAGGIFLAEIPDDPRSAAEWNSHRIYAGEAGEEEGRIAYPEGMSVADIDGDGTDDLLAGNVWLTHEADGRFRATRLAEVGGLIFAGVFSPGDAPQVVISAGDGTGPLRWNESVGDPAKPGSWVAHDLLHRELVHGHTLQLGDVDADGNLDIFAAEMAKWSEEKTEPDNPRATAYIFYGDGAGRFEATILVRGHGFHEGRLADLDGDGDLDILNKPYNWETPRVDVWLNDPTLPVPEGPDWTYVMVDDARGKWGDFGRPDWLRYFGIDAADMDGDGDLDVVSGRYVYRNPGREGTAWERLDLGANVDGMIAVDVDKDAHADVIAQALPEVVWLEADDASLQSWRRTVVGTLPQTAHNNGQGYGTADLNGDGRPEVLLTAADGIYAAQIPEDPGADSWTWLRIASRDTAEGFAVADIDGDGDADLVGGDRSGRESEPTRVVWWANPGALDGVWRRRVIGRTVHAVDRVVAADFNGDGRVDVAVSEERYPGEAPDAHLWWFEALPDVADKPFRRHLLVEQYSMNSLDSGDLDGDGDVDLVTGEHKGPHLRVQLLENDGEGTFLLREIDRGKECHLGMRLYDLDGDGDLDIVGHAWDEYRFLHLWWNEGS